LFIQTVALRHATSRTFRFAAGESHRESEAFFWTIGAALGKGPSVRKKRCCTIQFQFHYTEFCTPIGVLRLVSGSHLELEPRRFCSSKQGLWAKFYQGLRRPIPGPLASTALVKTCISCFY